MELESLNCEKFEKIEKNELGKLVGGTCQGYTETQGGTIPDPIFNLGYSNDYENNSGDFRYFMNGDMSETQLAAILAAETALRR